MACELSFPDLTFDLAFELSFPDLTFDLAFELSSLDLTLILPDMITAYCQTSKSCHLGSDLADFNDFDTKINRHDIPDLMPMSFALSNFYKSRDPSAILCTWQQIDVVLQLVLLWYQNQHAHSSCNTEHF